MPSFGLNHLVASLSRSSRNQVFAVAEEIILPVNTVLYEAGEVPEYLFFLNSGFASQVITLPENASAEVGLIGREGLVGHLALLGPGLSSSRCFMQSDGAGVRIPLPSFRRIFLDSEEVRDHVLAFTQAHTVANAYIAACNKLHDTETRLARWLLMVQDRLETDLLLLTQEFLAQMLGTRRMTVVTAAGALQRSGIIEYKRGHVRILQRQVLESAACECYGHIRSAYSGLYSSS